MEEHEGPRHRAGGRVQLSGEGGQPGDTAGRDGVLARHGAGDWHRELGVGVQGPGRLPQVN